MTRLRNKYLNSRLVLRKPKKLYVNFVATHRTPELTPPQEVHLQAVINANNASALGANAQQSYIPTPDAVRATGVKFDELYPKVFTEPATYIRFSSTIEDCIGVAYCMNEDDAAFLAQFNEGKDASGQPLKDKSKQCSEDTFEEVMNFFEEVSKREQPFANLGSAPLLTLDEMRNACDDDEPLSSDAQYFLSSVYEYWSGRKGDRPMMPSIKVRVLDATSEADEADPYVCFRRREVRQTRKTRGRDAQIVEKLKKLRWELEQGRSIVELVRLREETSKEQLEITRKVFDQRQALKEVKIAKDIVGEKGEDEELLVNQKVRLPGSLQTHGNLLTISSLSSKHQGLAAVSSAQHFDSIVRSAAAMLPKMISTLWLNCRRRMSRSSTTQSRVGRTSTGVGTRIGRI